MKGRYNAKCKKENGVYEMTDHAWLPRKSKASMKDRSDPISNQLQHLPIDPLRYPLIEFRQKINQLINWSDTC